MPSGFAPQYATFGSQTYQDSKGNWRRCGYDAVKTQVIPKIASNFAPRNGSEPVIEETKTICYFTQISHIVNVISTRIPIYSNFFFLGCWIFIATFALSVAISIIRPPATFGAETLNEKDANGNEIDKEKQDEKEMKRKERSDKRREKVQDRIEKRKEDNKYRIQKFAFLFFVSFSLKFPQILLFLPLKKKFRDDDPRGNEENIEQIQDLDEFIAQVDARSHL